MNPAKIKKMLWDLGHFHNPEMPTGIGQECDLELLSLVDTEMRTAIRSYQDFMRADFDEFSYVHHNRTGIANGEIGDATTDLFAMPRCGYPDYQRAGPVEANWPTVCRGNLKFGRNFQKLPGLSQEDTDRVFHAVVNNWTQALTDVVMDTMGVVGSASGLQIYAALKALGGSTLAWSYLANNNCGSTLQQRYNTRTNWSQISLPTATGTHEVGHAIGLEHNRDSSALMYPSINTASRARLGYPNATDLSQCRSIGYTLSGLPRPSEEDLFKPRDGGPNPPDPPDPPDDQLVFRGEFEAFIGGISWGKYILTPKPEV